VRGVDTNIVLRIFDRTDARQSSAVEKLIAEAAGSKDLLLNPIVLSELAWTLKRSYKKSRSVIADHLDLLLQSPEFVVPFSVEAGDAVRRYREGTADFADYLLAAINRASGCRSTLTFDQEAADDDQFTLLKV
jgi:predicted nucleic-acid-binding protein